ncbi:MAG: helix-hairpin-helix domain-containing protein [Isosphaeraceae bacterium]
MSREGASPAFGWSISARRGLCATVLLLAAALQGALRDTVPSHNRVASAPGPGLVVDLNTAPPAVLRALPRLGPVLVARIVAERERAPFASVAELDARVRGVGPVTVEALRPFLRVLPPTSRDAWLAGPRMSRAE